jgi:large subunit ribosomal protein L5
MNRFKKLYKEKISGELAKELGLDNVMEAPQLKKITLNAGIGDFRENREAVEAFESELSMLSGQKPSPRKARLSEAGFKIKKGDIVGYKVTIRGERMWAFLDKLINVVLPQVRDFKGLSLKSFDSRGNYSLGITEHVIFPEIDPNKVRGIRGLQVTLSLDAQNKEHAQKFLEKLGVPFTKE